jgi:hypothetical protein
VRAGGGVTEYYDAASGQSIQLQAHKKLFKNPWSWPIVVFAWRNCGKPRKPVGKVDDPGGVRTENMPCWVAEADICKPKSELGCVKARAPAPLSMQAAMHRDKGM